jgi:2-C-methyl-D-erythritol 4-phosphate cytidylyltransferase
MYSLRAFSQCEKVGEIIISVRECDQEAVEALCGRYCSNKPFSVVIGGETRQESVANAFSHVHEKSDFVMIHDAARPLIGEREILLLIEKGKRYGAACAGEKVIDTVKEIGKNGFISKTVPRDHLYTVQTPQIFRTDLYRVALALAKRDGIAVTDDCALAEHAGFSVHICELGIFNLKLTTMQDVEKIEMIIREKGKIL